MTFWRLYRAMSRSVVNAFCFGNRLINVGLHVLCMPFVLEMTRLGIKMEAMIAREGLLKGASEWLVSIAADGIHVHGAENIPLAGPVLFPIFIAADGPPFFSREMTLM